MKSFAIGFAAVAWVLLASVLPAGAAVEVLEARSELSHWVLYASRHSPCSLVSWTHLPAAGTAFELQAEGYGDCMNSTWTGHCGADGIAFGGDLVPAADGRFGWWAHLEVTFAVRLLVSTPARLTAVRDIEGMFPATAHTVTLTHPDGTEDVLLGAGAAEDVAERQLDTGEYGLELAVFADGTWFLPFTYRGSVVVGWAAPVSGGSQTWGGVKSLFR